jgi:hypothetical protein
MLWCLVKWHPLFVLIYSQKIIDHELDSDEDENEVQMEIPDTAEQVYTNSTKYLLSSEINRVYVSYHTVRNVFVDDQK